MRFSMASSPGERGLLLGADRVDVAGLGQRRQPDVALAGTLEQFEQEEAGALLAGLLNQLVEGCKPFAGLGLVEIGQVLLEVIEKHGGSEGRNGRPGGRRAW